MMNTIVGDYCGCRCHGEGGVASYVKESSNLGLVEVMMLQLLACSLCSNGPCTFAHAANSW